MYSLKAGAVEISTEEARNSRTIRRLSRTRSESVLMDIPASTLREHAGASMRAPSSSTTQTRQTFTGVRLSRKHRVGVSMPSLRVASRMVAPSGTETGRPSILISIILGDGEGGAAGTGPRGTGIRGMGAEAEAVWSVLLMAAAVWSKGFMKTNSIAGERIQWRWT